MNINLKNLKVLRKVEASAVILIKDPEETFTNQLVLEKKGKVKFNQSAGPGKERESDKSKITIDKV